MSDKNELKKCRLVVDMPPNPEKMVLHFATTISEVTQHTFLYPLRESSIYYLETLGSVGADLVRACEVEGVLEAHIGLYSLQLTRGVAFRWGDGLKDQVVSSVREVMKAHGFELREDDEDDIPEYEVID